MARTIARKPRVVKPTKTVLLTGFEPFGGDAVNPSEEVARQLNGCVIGGYRVVGELLPCVFGAALVELKKLLKANRPALVICTGQAGGRSGITPERVAINVDDARIPDNAGQRPAGRPVVRGGPAAYWSTLPFHAIAAALEAKGIAATVSQTAGTFVCNHVFYGLMHALRQTRAVRGGFIHVPFLPEQAAAGQPSLPLETMVEGIALAIEVCGSTRRDAPSAGGQIS